MSGRKNKMTVQEEHEAFRNRLVDDVLGSDSGDKVPMEKVVMMLWQFRDDPSVITFMARFVAKYAGSRHVFDGIEFYLPQLAHMIIHLEVEWDDAILERFALVIAQQSLHFALQLNWILQGALEDYQPELPPEPAGDNHDDDDNNNNSNTEFVGGTPNPNYNPVIYTRCLKLLRNVERCVVYGKPRAAALQKLYEQGKITKKELFLLEQADRRFNALQITAADDEHAVTSEREPPLDGWADVQMPFSLQAKAGGPYVTRFCSLDKHVLNCNKIGGRLDRAMSLERALVALEGTTILRIQTRTYQFRLRFKSPEEAKLWLRRITEEADTTSLFQQSLHSMEFVAGQRPQSPAEKRAQDNQGEEVDENAPKRMGVTALKQDLTPAQRDRYDFFQNERAFVQALTDLAEELRFVDRAERKKLAPGKVSALSIPPTSVYLPLCNSSDIWRRVTSTVPEETRVFNTKERCPVIMHFVSTRGEWHNKTNHSGKGGPRVIKTDPNLDVAEYMHSYLEVSGGLQRGLMEDVVELAEEEEAAEDIEVSADSSISASSNRGMRNPNIWQEEDDHEPPTPHKTEDANHTGSPQRAIKGNRRMQRLLRESVVFVPTKLARRLNKGKTEKTRKHVVSVMDRQTEMQAPVPIVGRLKDEWENASVGDGSVVSIEKSSIFVRDQILFGDLDEGDIDFECIDRAKKFVSSGISWAEKSAAMLEKVIKETKVEHSDSSQLEIISCMSKSNDDLRQEVFVMQMIHYFKSVFAKAELPLWLKTYRILSTSASTGLLEVLTDATSLDGLKKSEGYPTKGGLRKYFEMVYGDPDSKSFHAAQTNFMQSLAGYAVVSYLLGLKDRHNGNIMIDTRGHLIFIDFGFALGMAPGHEFSFERAPFKLTKEFVEVMGGVGSQCYKEFKRLFVTGIEEARKNSQIALGMVEIMMYKSNYPCFSGWRYGKGRALKGLEKRLMLRVPDRKVKRRAKRLIRRSRRHFGTYLYDLFQKATNGYAI